MTDVVLKIDGLNKLTTALKAKGIGVRVGILPQKDARNDGSSKNSEIGAIYEYGTSSRPQQSFIRVPLMEEMDSRIENSSDFSEADIKTVIKDGSLVSLAKKIGEEAVAVIVGAFDSGGYGKWQDPLVDTGQLRDSIGSEVVS